MKTVKQKTIGLENVDIVRLRRAIKTIDLLMQCVQCGNDPATCGCTEEDEDERGYCRKYRRENTATD